MSWRGLPDWHQPPTADGPFAAYEQPGVWFAPPRCLVPSGMEIDRFAQDRGETIARFGIVTCRWAAEADADDAVGALGEPGAVAVRPLPIQGGLVRLTGPATLVDPRTAAPALGDAFPLDQAGISTFVASVTLDDAATELVLEADRRGTALIGADAVLLVQGVAARHEGEVEVDLARLSAATAQRWPTGAVTVAELQESLAGSPAAFGIRFNRGEPGDDRARLDAGLALLDRFLARLAVPEPPAPRDAEAQVLGARLPARVQWRLPAAQGRLRWDLAQPMLAPRPFALASRAIQPDAEPAVIREHQPPVLASGWHRLRVDTTATPPWHGGMLGFEAEIPAAPPARPQTLRLGELLSGSDAATVDVGLAPTEELTGTITGTVVLDSGEQTFGPPLEIRQEALLLRTDAFDAAFWPVEISPAIAACTITIDWFRDDATSTPANSTTLTPGTTRLTLLAPRAEAAVVMATAADPEGRRSATHRIPAGPLLLDAFSFPGTGSRRLEVEADFADTSVDALLVELTPEGGGDTPASTASIPLTRSRPRAEWTRFVASPFTTGYRWRPAGETQWSDVLHDDTLRVPAPTKTAPEETMQAQFNEAGLRLFAIHPAAAGGGAEAAEWVFVPQAPTIVTQPDGARAMSLLEVGGEHLITVGGRLSVTDEQQDHARHALAQRTGIRAADIMLRPALLQGVRAKLALTHGGTEEVLAESATSGAWPYDAAFHQRLTPSQADAVRAAWAGERHLLHLRYEATLHPGGTVSQAWGTSSTTSSTTSTTTTRTVDGRVASETRTSTSSGSKEHAETPPAAAPITLRLELDGADWARARNG